MGTDWHEARAIAHACATALPAGRVALDAAAGLVLAEDLRALVALPPFDASAMDGWAVCGDGPWRVVGEVLAGDVASVQLRDGDAVVTATGAAVPVGATSVLPLEQGHLAAASSDPHTGDLLSGATERGRHVRSAGEEAAVGEVLLARGTVLSPAALGLAAGAGHDSVLVHPRATVRAVVTGSELVDHGLPSAARIRDAVGPLLRAAVPGLAAVSVRVDVVPDDRDRLRAALTEAAPDTSAPTRADVVLVSGSSSAGPADHLATVLRELDADVLVDGVDVRPGHPQLLARLPDGTWVLGLPGNPLAALVALVTLAEPLLAALAGRPLPELARATWRGEPSTAATTRLVPITLTGGAAHPTGHAGSAMLRGAAVADHLAVVPPGCAAGQGVEVVALP